MNEYYYINRPPGIGCQPDGFDIDTRETWMPRRRVGDRYFLGTVSYPEPLDPEDVWQYELYPVDPVERAECTFWCTHDPSLRQEYLDTPREDLESMAEFCGLSQAALVILKAQEGEQ
jgi:hypothetical protein